MPGTVVPAMVLGFLVLLVDTSPRGPLEATKVPSSELEKW